LTDFGWQVIRRSNGSLRAVICMLENSSDSKVSNLDSAVLRHKDVLSFQVSMKDFSIMNVFYCQSHLHKPIKDLVLWVANFEFLIHNSYLFLFSSNLQSLCTCLHRLRSPLRCTNTFCPWRTLCMWWCTGVSLIWEHVPLNVNCLILTSLIASSLYFLSILDTSMILSVRNLTYLHDIVLSVGDTLNEDGITETAFADDFEFSVLLHY